MKRKPGSVITDRHVTINYLLGGLPEAERLRIEREFFSTDEAFEEMLAVEDELFADYARGVLSPDERAAFDARFLATPEGRRRLAFARALMDALAAHAPAHGFQRGWLARLGLGGPALQDALVAAVLVLAVATAWLARDGARWRSEASAARMGQAGVAQPPAATPLVVSVLLSPGLTRGSGKTARITLPADADIVRLQLEALSLIPGSYRASLRTAEGDTIWSGRITRRPDADLIGVDIPARLLATHDYEMAIDDPSGSPAASYVLSVVRR